MPPNTAYIPLPNRGSSSSLRAMSEPAFNTPVRCTLAVLAWLAFGIASYLAWSAVTGSSVAGCSMGGGNGCDVVLSSSWSKWLGIPVAVMGLGCYAALATLSILLWLRNEEVRRWISTAFVMLSIVAAGASLWFIGVQIFAIHDYCQFCLVTDACGIIIGAVATFFAARSWLADRGTPQQRTMQPGLMSLRTAIPSGARPAQTATSTTAPAPAVKISEPPPALGYAVGGALPLLLLLIGGQLLFATKTWDVQKVALTDSINMTGSDETKPTDDPTNPTTRVAMRPTTESDVEKTSGKLDDTSTEPSATQSADASKDADDAVHANDSSSKTPVAPPDIELSKERLVKFLGGKLTLDTYKNPIIGSPDAPHIVVEMVSYDCTHCRKMHATIQQALERYGDQVALLVMPVPLDKDCNKLVTDPAASHQGACGTAKLALGIARLDPLSFARFHDFLMSGKDDKPPKMERVIPKAYGLVDQDRLRELSRGKEVGKQLDGYIELFGKLQASKSATKTLGLPVQILGDTIMSGSVEKPEDVFKAWEENLGVKPM